MIFCLVFSKGSWNDATAATTGKIERIQDLIDNGIKIYYPPGKNELSAVHPIIEYRCDPSVPTYKFLTVNFKDFSIVISTIAGTLAALLRE